MSVHCLVALSLCLSVMSVGILEASVSSKKYPFRGKWTYLQFPWRIVLILTLLVSSLTHGCCIMCMANRSMSFYLITVIPFGFVNDEENLKKTGLAHVLISLRIIPWLSNLLILLYYIFSLLFYLLPNFPMPSIISLLYIQRQPSVPLWHNHIFIGQSIPIRKVPLSTFNANAVHSTVLKYIPVPALNIHILWIRYE